MSPPLPPDNDSAPEHLPLRRNRTLRNHEAEIIRQEFIRSRRSCAFPPDESSATPSARDEP